MGDQWYRWCIGANWGTSEMGDNWNGPIIGEKGNQWVQTMQWWTYELGDQWDGDQWDGGTNESGVGVEEAIRCGTNGMGGTWVLIEGTMRWGNNEMGTNEMGDQGCAPKEWPNMENSLSKWQFSCPDPKEGPDHQWPSLVRIRVHDNKVNYKDSSNIYQNSVG